MDRSDFAKQQIAVLRVEMLNHHSLFHLYSTLCIVLFICLTWSQNACFAHCEVRSLGNASGPPSGHTLETYLTCECLLVCLCMLIPYVSVPTRRLYSFFSLFPDDLAPPTGIFKSTN